MFRNYVITALRNLVRNKLYAAINIAGLALGLAAALLIALFVRDEFSYDKWIPGYERVYTVHSTTVERYGTFHSASVPSITAGFLAQDFPHQISAITRFSRSPNWDARHGDVEYSETITWADPNLFKVLPLPAIAGNLATALQQPDGVVLTRSMARKYFGKDNPIGETLELDRKLVMRVTAVLEDLPSNTNLALGIIASGRNAAMNLDRPIPASGPIPGRSIYLRLAPGESGDSLRKALPAFEQRHPRFQSAGNSISLELLSLADLHLHSPPVVGQKPPGSAATAYSALAIALLIVAIASINFVNLTTARATRRAVEVGVRKVSGAERRNLIVQFIGESTIYAVLGMVLAILLAQLLLPSFNGFLQRTIAFDYARDPRLLGALFVVVVAVGVLAGAYPALVLSRFSPAGVLKGSVTGHLRGGRSRQILVALQFMVLIVLALLSTTVYRQAHFAMNEALRFDKDQMLVIRIGVDGGGMLPCDSSFATAVHDLPGVRGTACASKPIPNPLLGGPKTIVTGPEGGTTTVGETVVDFSFFDLFEIKPLAGRTFSRDFSGDLMPQDGSRTAPLSVVINETLSRALGFAAPQSAIGQTVRWHPIGPFTGATVAAAIKANALPDGLSQIVGVVPDFARASIRQATEPAIFWVSPVGHTMLNVKLQSSQVPETLAAIDKLWKQVGLQGPPGPINRIFLDQQIEVMYRDVTLLQQAMAAFAAVAVFVACLGLLGLAAFAAESRTKEIGVRKALGASRLDILRLMLWEFAKPVLWASLIAWPVAYFITRHWLEGFAERVDAGLWTFPAASLLALVIAAVTVSAYALLIARSQPATALRYE